ncbi:HNH endonuclease [Streptomyces sp. 900116325]
MARPLADTCEFCGSKGNVQVHYVRALADLAHAGWQPSDWARVMLHRRRKTVVVRDTCHDRIHSERPARPLTQ